MLKITYKILILLFFLIITSAGIYIFGQASGGIAKIRKTSLSPENIHIGTPITCDVRIKMPWHRRFTQDPTVDLPDGLQLLSMNKSIVGVGFDSFTWSVKVIIQPYDIKKFKKIKVKINITPNKMGDNSIFETYIPEFEVKASIKKNELKDKIPLFASGIYEKFKDKDQLFWYWVLGGTLLAICIIALIIFLLNRKKEIAKIKAPAWEIANSAISQLETQLPMQAEHFFVKITDIIRVYIQERFEFNAAEQTTPEFMEKVKYSDVLPNEHKIKICDFLNSADLVKFAQQSATQEQLMLALKQATSFIAETIPTEKPEEVGEGK